MTREIEETLKAQLLRRPSAALDDRIAALLDGAADAPPAPLPFTPVKPQVRRWSVIGTMIGAALAACFVLGLVLLNRDSAPSQPAAPAVAVSPAVTPAVEPVVEPLVTAAPTSPTAVAAAETVEEMPDAIAIEEMWEEITPGEIVSVDGAAVRSYERQVVQQTRWIDEKNNVEIELTIPTREVVYTVVQVD